MNCCWLCEHTAFRLYKGGNLPPLLSAKHFAISSADYGNTSTLIQCRACGFVQSQDLTQHISTYYEQLVDESYLRDSSTRLRQAEAVVKKMKRWTQPKKWLDIGAGCGYLLEAVSQVGCEAVGVEPSYWLCEHAQKKGLRIYRDTFPSTQLSGTYDVISLLDVIEHVENPLQVMKEAVKLLAPKGYLLLATPDRTSLAARCMGKRWWHFRCAHIGYFNKKNLVSLHEKVQLHIKSMQRPAWYFPMDYVWTRLGVYAPVLRRISLPKRLAQRVITLNLRDSWLSIAQKN